MQQLIVCNFLAVDGRSEDENHGVGSFFKYQHPDSQGADSFEQRQAMC